MKDYSFHFPKNLYSDVRIETISETKIDYLSGELSDLKQRNHMGAFIRIFDGKRWYYSSVCDMDKIQYEIYSLACMAKPDSSIFKNPIVMNFEVNSGCYIKFNDNDITNIAIDKKDKLLKKNFPLLNERPMINMWAASYVDRRVVKDFYSSKGANIVFDTQMAGMEISFNLVYGKRKFSERFQKQSSTFYNLQNNENELIQFIDKCESFILESRRIESGEYPIILSPFATGIFAHESFGHKSEADFIVGDELIKKAWPLGKKIGSSYLNIVDDGDYEQSWFVPFDDEGTKSKKTYLIKDGILTDRLHSASTAALLGENITGNARAINYNFEPIVRMTSTFILPGRCKKQQLFNELKHGIYIDTVKSGSGRSIFTLTPSLAYYIKNGCIAEPVNISLITGNLFETLDRVDALSDELEIFSFVNGGCGKLDQFPLPVKFGGPYMRVKGMNVQ